MIGGWTSGQGLALHEHRRAAPRRPRRGRAAALRRTRRHGLRRAGADAARRAARAAARRRRRRSAGPSRRRERTSSSRRWCARSSSPSGRAPARCAIPPTRACARTSPPPRWCASASARAAEEPRARDASRRRRSRAWIADGPRGSRRRRDRGRGPHAEADEPRKVLYPQTGFTKADLIGYYAAVAPVLLPHLHDRPLTLKRYPNGVEGKYFYEKQSPSHRPDWVATATVWSRHSKRDIDYTLCQDLPTLRVAREPRRHRAAPVAVARRRHRAPDRARLRPGSGAAGEHRGVLRGRPRAARACSTSSGCPRSRRPRGRRGCRSTSR